MPSAKTSDPTAIHKSGKNGASAGCYVMTKDGHLVLVPPGAFGDLKEGQRLATQEDIDRKTAEEAARQTGGDRDRRELERDQECERAAFVQHQEDERAELERRLASVPDTDGDPPAAVE